MSAVAVGRREELDRLAELLADDRPVALVGEAGVGKTTLLQTAAAASGRTVRQGGALSTLDWLDYLALERALGRPMIAGDPVAVATDVQAQVADAVLLLDDLQWAASATLEVVAALAGRVGMLVGVRTGEAGTTRAVDQLRGAGFTVLELDGLPTADATALVTQLRPDLTPAARARLVERTGGNPLLICELAATGEPSASLRLALAARLRRLDAVGREAFGVLALAGRPVPASALGDAEVKSLLAADVAVPGAAGIEARHALLAEVAVEQMESDEMRRLHARIAEHVDDEGEAARHFALAGLRERALAAAVHAADATTRPAEQASHLAIAAACVDGPEADELRLRAARALEAAHNWDDMVATLALIDEGNREAQAAACLLRARGAYSAGDVDGLRAALARGLELCDGTGSDTEVQLRIEATRVPVFVDFDKQAGLEAARAGYALAQERGVDVTRARYLLGTAFSVFDEPGGVEHLQGAMAAARAAGDGVTEFVSASNLISTLEGVGDQELARDVADEYIARAQDLGLGQWERLISVARVALDFHGGNYARMLAQGEMLLDEPLEARSLGQLLELYCVTLVDVGRIDEALRRLTDARHRLVADSRGHMEELWVRAEAAFWGGRPAEAAALADEYTRVNEGDANSLFGVITRAWARFDLGLDAGEPVAPQERPILVPIPVEVEGVRALGAGDAATAAELLARAGQLWAPHHRRGELRSLWGAGEALRRTGDLSGAVRLLEQVEARAEANGMRPLLARVHRSLRAAGERRSAPRVRAVGDSLTGRQRQVLALVAEGLTNAQIAARLGISRHTVVTQLGSASAKLGASSRAQAATLAAAG